MATHQLDLSTDTKELPAAPMAPNKEEILANTSEMDDVAPLKPTKVIKMRRQTLRKRAATAANRLAGGRSTRDWDVHGNSAKNLCDLGVPVFRDCFTPSTRVVSGRAGRGCFFFDFEAVRTRAGASSRSSSPVRRRT